MPLSAATPKARMLARVAGVDVSRIAGSGPGGAVLAHDVTARPRVRITPLAAAAARFHNVDALSLGLVRVRRQDVMDAAQASRSQELTPRRQAFIGALAAAAGESVPYTLFADIETTAVKGELLRLRAAGEEISLSDMFLMHVSRALTAHPKLNSTLEGNRWMRHAGVALGYAVSADGVVLTPVIRNCEKLDPAGISIERRRLTGLAASRRLKPADLSGGTFTVTNLGAGIVSFFTPVLNLPQTAILGIAGTHSRAVFDGPHSLREAEFTGFSLTMDHRVLDGLDGAAFLDELARAMSRTDRI